MRSGSLAIGLIAAFLSLVAATAAADGLPDGIGVVTPSGSVFTSEITAPLDTDDYVFQGYPGTVVAATVHAAKRSGFQPSVEIIRPDGSVLGDGDRLSFHATPTSANAKATLDATGWWKVRVLGVPTERDPTLHDVTARSAGGYSASVRYRLAAVPPLPLPSASFHVSAHIAERGEADVFHFPGYDGQSFSARLGVPKTSALEPALQLIRPDGQVATTLGQGTEEKALAVDQALDASGTWAVRVTGEETTPGDTDHTDATTGLYSLRIKLGRAPEATLLPDENGQYRLTVPARGGARISYSLTFAGDAPSFNSFVDPLGRPVAEFPGGLAVTNFVLSSQRPFGDYVATFDAPPATPDHVLFQRRVRLPAPAKRRVARLASKEPLIRTTGVRPTSGIPGTRVTVTADFLVDETSTDVGVGILLGTTPLVNVNRIDAETVQGFVPEGLPIGVHDVVVTSTSGQAGVRRAAFERIPQPVVTSVDPPVGTALGNFEITLRGEHFRPSMGVLVDGELLPIVATVLDTSTLRFSAPPHAAGFVTFGVRDLASGADSPFADENFEYVTTPAIGRVSPPTLPLLVNDTIVLDGVFFFPTDKVFLETTTANVFEELTATQTTYVDFNHHRFVAPLRPKGTYRVYVEDTQGRPNPRRTRDLVYFSFADATAASGLSSGADPYDAVSSTLADVDADGDLDLVLARRGGPTAAATSQTRIVLNDGRGVFTDATASMMPASGADDWRADRIAAADVNGDGFVDLFLATNSKDVPSVDRSHTRVLVNEARGGTGVNATQRVFRDRTSDVMAPPRTMRKYGVFGGSAEEYVSDNWRGLDLWIGDLDKNGGPPDIVLTHDEVKDDDNPNADVFRSGVYCGNYCSSVQTFAYSYTFYWGGSRSFVWDKTARGGLGRYKFDANFFPRVSGPIVPTQMPGPYVWACSPHYNSVCKGGFTPFTGKRVAVGDLDLDGKLDVAVVSNQTVQRRTSAHVPVTTPYVTISSLQVGMNGPFYGDQRSLVDVTAPLTALGLDLRGDALAIASTGFPSGGPEASIALAKAQPGSGSALTLLRFTGRGKDVAVQDVTASELPAPGTDQLQAGDLRFADIDQDGDLDLVLLAPASPDGSGSALRILRNDVVAGSNGIFTRPFDTLVDANTSPSEHFEGDALLVGDITGDGFLDALVSRGVSTGDGSETRIVRSDH